MGLHQNVPKINIRAYYGVEDGGGVVEIGGLRGGANGNELGDQEMILLVASADDVGMNLIKISDSFASFQKWQNGG